MTAGSGEALRQQLSEAAQKAVIAWEADAWGLDSSPTDAEDAYNAAIVAVAIEAVVPVVEAALAAERDTLTMSATTFAAELAAARVATATEIAEAIEALRLNVTLPKDPALRAAGILAANGALDHAARLARGSVPAPKGDRKPSDMRHVGGYARRSSGRKLMSVSVSGEGSQQ